MRNKAIHLTHRKLDYGLATLILLITCILQLTSCSMQNKNNSYHKDSIDLGHEPVHKDMVLKSDLDRYPAPVARWLMSSGIMGKPNIHRVW